MSLENLSIKYFTASILEKVAKDEDSTLSQSSYLNALKKYSGNALEVFYGSYSLLEARAKQVNSQEPQKWPRDCDQVTIWKVEEKKSDVSLALQAFKDCILGEIDHAVVVTNDTDIQPALELINRYTKVKIGLVIPTRDHERIPNQELRDEAIWVRTHITNEELSASELPRVIQGRRPYTKPISWYPHPKLIKQALTISKSNGMNSSEVFKWLQKPNPHWNERLPLDMLNDPKDGEIVLKFMAEWKKSSQNR